eukprot:TRINITY_DN2316_c0_g1_i2.p1 TRINITY_DN2316_c0_g1~~TRINITY_DN2316_c0_g1_i2.p1  ORF type:complete len:205 (-),score=12.30 TRINITY_DN2316_c0_g1_i2:135-749(-)
MIHKTRLLNQRLTIKQSQRFRLKCKCSQTKAALQFLTRKVNNNEEIVLEQVALLRAVSYYEGDQSRFVNSYIRTFQQKEVRALKKRLQQECYCLVAYTKDYLVIGCLDIKRLSESGYYINNVVVDENFRRLGIGKALMDAAEKLAIDKNPSQNTNISLSTEVDIQNEAAYNLYKSCGFVDQTSKNLPPNQSKVGLIVMLEKVLD